MLKQKIDKLAVFKAWLYLGRPELTFDNLMKIRQLTGYRPVEIKYAIVNFQQSNEKNQNCKSPEVDC